jgi:hypothetical protein
MRLLNSSRLMLSRCGLVKGLCADLQRRSDRGATIARAAGAKAGGGRHQAPLLFPIARPAALACLFIRLPLGPERKPVIVPVLDLRARALIPSRDLQ